MIELQKVKRDIVNYGTLKVYTTFLSISEDETDPELFNANQLKEIFSSQFDIIKININFVELGENDEWVSAGKKLLVFKLSDFSNNKLSYMSNVDDEGKISSLVLTKSEEEVSLEVNEYDIAGKDMYLHEVTLDPVGDSGKSVMLYFKSDRSREVTSIWDLAVLLLNARTYYFLNPSLILFDHDNKYSLAAFHPNQSMMGAYVYLKLIDARDGNNIQEVDYIINHSNNKVKQDRVSKVN